jgi:hypothetical protein
LASPALNEQGWNNNAIKRQLAHIEDRACNHAKNLIKQTKMMPAWGAYLDSLASSISVMPIDSLESK